MRTAKTVPDHKKKGKNLRQTGADIKEEAMNETLRGLAKAGDWESVVAVLDAYDANNERRHASHRADMDITQMDRAGEQKEWYSLGDQLKLGRNEDWLDVIFTRHPRDLYQLTESPEISEALQTLTETQMQVLFENVIHQVPTDEVAQELQCSVRNVTKHRQRGLERIRKRLGKQKNHRTQKTPGD